MIEKIRKIKKDSFRLITFILLLEAGLVLMVIFFLLFSVISGNIDDFTNSSNVSSILGDAIRLYGTEFTGALAVYTAEHSYLDEYTRDEFKYTKKEIIEMVKNDSDLQEIKEAFEKKFGGIVSEDSRKRVYFNWYFPIANNYKMSFFNNWLNPRPEEREHLGIDLICDVTVPIVAVESGTITNIGWNELGGWRIGITGSNGSRYWYYAHMRKLHPYVKTLKKGSSIKGGQVIGYVGSTGYSTNVPNEAMPENSSAVNTQFEPHLHIGVYEDTVESPYNPYPILETLKNNRVTVERIGDEFVSKEKSIDARLVNMLSLNIDINTISSLSAKYESSGEPGIIADNPGDPGGKSYGVFQFAVNRGSLSSFLIWLSGTDVDLYNRLMAAREIDNGYGDTFDKVWEEIASEDPVYFYTLQYDYIKVIYYDPVVDYFYSKGFDIESRSQALQAVVWSTSVQHGPSGAMEIIELQNLKGTDREIIIGIYTERMKVDEHFESSSITVRQNVYERFEAELQDALAMLEEEEGG